MTNTEGSMNEDIGRVIEQPLADAESAYIADGPSMKQRKPTRRAEKCVRKRVALDGIPDLVDSDDATCLARLA